MGERAIWRSKLCLRFVSGPVTMTGETGTNSEA